MDPHTAALAGLAVLVFLMLARVPVAASLLVTGALGLFAMTSFLGDQFSASLGLKRMLGFLSSDPYSFVTSFTLIAVPMFLLMGNVAFYAKATSEGFETARIWLARLPGGLALATLSGCALFASISGSSLATAAAMGKLAVPEMLKARYDKGLATGVVAAGGTLGALIPPSILMVIYGVFTETSIGRLLIAGFLPGLLTAAMWMVMVSIRARLNPNVAPRVDVRYTWSEKIESLRGTAQFIVLFLVVMGSIYAGLATATEASAIGAAGMLAIGWFRRKLDRQGFRQSVLDTMQQSSSIFAIAIGAKVFVAFVAYTQIATDLANYVAHLQLHPAIVLVGLSAAYLVLGMFMDPLGIMLLTLPVVVPVIQHLGYDLVWFGVIMVKYLEIGMITPPVGLNVYVLKSTIGDTVKLETIFRGIGWFLAVDLITVTFLIAFPGFVTWLPDLVFAK